MRKTLKIFVFFLTVIGLVAAYFLLRRPGQANRDLRVMEWLRSPLNHSDWVIKAGVHCNDAPFLFPTDGYVGYLWGDSFRPGHSHQGIDIFGGDEPGKTPVIAVYDGYLTRLPEWKSTLIIRIPEDPFQIGRQIWTYYTHFADAEGNSYIDGRFPPGTYELPVKAGELLGYQGNFSGTPGNPVGVHLHFSIVRDDGKGQFLNELDIRNTIDPSPYLGMSLNADQNQGTVLQCSPVNTSVVQ